MRGIFKTILFCFFIVFTTSLLLLVIYKEAIAAEYTAISTSDGDCPGVACVNYQSTYLLQTIGSGQYNYLEINKADVWIEHQKPGGGNVTFELWKGTFSPTSCNFASSTCGGTQLIVVNKNINSYPATSTFLFSQSIILDNASNYFIKFTSDNGVYNGGNYIQTTSSSKITGNLYAFVTWPPTSLLAGGRDLKFKLYYDFSYIPPFDNLPYYDTVTIDSTLTDWRSDINTVNYQMCFIGENCNLWFSFNQKTLGKTIHLVPNIQYEQNPNFSLSDTVISYTTQWQNYVTVPQQTTATTTEYCLYLVDNYYGDILRCKTKIDWVASTTFDELFNIFDIAHACDSVATSTGGFDDWRYGLECAARKFAYWALTPSPEAIKYFSNNGEKIKTVFPFNTYFNLVRAAQRSIASTTLSGNDNFGLPFINNVGQFYILPVLASSSLPNAIGQTNSSLFRNSLSWLMWLVVAFLIYVTFKKI